MLKRRTPMKRGGPLQRRSQPARKPMKRVSRKPAATAAEKRHMGRLAAMGCLVCGNPPEIHHVTSDGNQRITRSHARTVPLCPAHHRTGPDAVHATSHAIFRDRFGVDLLEWADAAWAISEAGENSC